MEEAAQEEGWVVCRIFKKKYLNKTLDKPLSSSPITADQTLHYMERTCKEENEADNSARYLIRPVDTPINYVHHDRLIMKLPSLESPNSISSQNCYQPMITDNEGSITNQTSYPLDPVPSLDSWATLDRLFAYQLNGQTEISRQLPCFPIDQAMAYCTPNDLQLQTLRSSFPIPSNRSYHGAQDYNNEIDLWNFTTRSSSDTLCHLSDTGA